MNKSQTESASVRFRTFSAAALLCLAMVATPAGALTFSFGEVTGSFDSTFSAGLAYRLGNPSRDLYATTASFEGVAGLAASVNGDDGNLNFGKGFYSSVLKGTHDLQLKYQGLTGFFRTSYFKDFEYNSTKRTPLSLLGRRKAADDIGLLDAYLSYKFDIGGQPANIRFGRQVLSWGESTFMPNGINAINPADISRLRTPGSELREALKPVPLISASFSLSESLSLDAFYLLAFKKTDIDPRGTYFSSNDFASIGGNNVFLGFGSLADTGALGGVPRTNDRYASDSGQYGLALHYLASGLGDTEFGLYYLKYHSRLPIISAFTPAAPINTNLQGPLTAALMRAGLPQATAATQAAGIWQLIVLSQTSPGSMTPEQLATLQAAQTQAAIAGARQIAFLTAAATGRYFVEFPEDIQLVGVSFNTVLGRTGISLQGEVSVKQDQPLQVDDVELLFATLSAINPAFGANNQLGNFLGQLNREVSGFKRQDVWQAQVTATKLFGRLFGASQWTFVAEVGAISVPNLPDKSALRFDGPATYTSGSAASMAGTGNGAFAATPLDFFPDDFSWGYQVLAKFDYNNVFAGVNMVPSIGFAYDVSGTTPLPLGNFVEGRNTLTVGVEFTYQNKWSLDLRYVRFAGGGVRNLIHDRDFVSTTVKYSF